MNNNKEDLKMVKRPNRAVLNDALDEYRDAMRPFIVRAMKRVKGKGY